MGIVNSLASDDEFESDDPLVSTTDMMQVFGRRRSLSHDETGNDSRSTTPRKPSSSNFQDDFRSLQMKKEAAGLVVRPISARKTSDASDLLHRSVGNLRRKLSNMDASASSDLRLMKSANDTLRRKPSLVVSESSIPNPSRKRSDRFFSDGSGSSSPVHASSPPSSIPVLPLVLLSGSGSLNSSRMGSGRSSTRPNSGRLGDSQNGISQLQGLVESIVITFQQKEHVLEVESSWSVFRIVLLEQVYLERNGVVLKIDDEMDLFVESSNVVLLPNQSLLAQTSERRFRLELKSSQSVNRDSLRVIRSNSRLRPSVEDHSLGPTATFNSSGSSGVALTGTEKLKALPKKQDFRKFDFLRVVFVGDSHARRDAAASLAAEAPANVLHELQVKGMTISAIEIESLDMLAMFAAPKALFVVAVDAGQDEDERVQRIRGLVRVCASKMPSGTRPQIVIYSEKAALALMKRIQGAFRSVVREVIDAASSLPALLSSFVQRQVPYRYTLFLSEIVSLAKDEPIANISMVKEKASVIGLPGPDLSSALQFAADIGMILYFPMHALLRNYVILDLHTMLELYNTLVRFSNNFSLGVASPQSFETIWKLSAGFTQVAIRLLAELGLLFVDVLPSEPEIPAFVVICAGLPKRELKPPSMQAVRQFKFTFLDQSLFDRLMASFYMQRKVVIDVASRNGFMCHVAEEEAKVEKKNTKKIM